MSDGSRHALYLIPEVTYGTTPTTPAFLAIRHKATTLGVKKDTLMSEEIRNDRQLTDFRMGQRQVGGNIEVELSGDAQLDAMLEALMGGTWTGDVLKAGTTRRSFSFLRVFEDMVAGSRKYHLTKGGEIASMELKVTAKSVTSLTFEVMGKTLTFETAAPVSSTFGALSTTGVMDGFTGSISEGGSAIAIVTEVSFKLENNMERRFAIGSTDTLLPTQGRSIVTGSLTAYFESDALYQKFLSDTESTLDFTLSNGSYSYAFSFPKIKYTDGNPDVQGEKAILLTMPFQAVYDGVALTQLSITRTP
jgi:hypothetical protein